MKQRIIKLGAPSALGIDTNDQTKLDRELQQYLLGSKATEASKKMVSDVIKAASAELTRQIKLSTRSMFTPDTEAAAALMFGDADREQVDLRWAAAYRVLDRRSARTRSFKIADSYNAVTFEVYKEGERINTGIVEATGDWYEADILAGGFKYSQFSEQWTDDWDVSEGIAAMLMRWAKKQAKLAYSVISASGALTQTYDATGATVLAKDINTINAAIQKIKDAIYVDTAPVGGQQTEEEYSTSTPMLCLYNPTGTLVTRVQAIQAAFYHAANSNVSVGEPTNPLTFIDSRDVTADKFIVCLPGRKNVFAPAIDLQTFEQIDPTIAGVGAQNIGQGAYKHVRADSNQVCLAAAS